MRDTPPPPHAHGRRHQHSPVRFLLASSALASGVPGFGRNWYTDFGAALVVVVFVAAAANAVQTQSSTITAVVARWCAIYACSAAAPAKRKGELTVVGVCHNWKCRSSKCGGKEVALWRECRDCWRPTAMRD